MAKLRKQRLLKLADYLEQYAKVAPQETKIGWNMGCYFSKDSGDQRITSSCGSAACAAGHAGFIPAFNRAGYRVLSKGYNAGMPKYKNKQPGAQSVISFFTSDSGKGYEPNYFEGSEDPAVDAVDQIFYGGYRMGPAQKAQQIRDLVNAAA